MFGRFRIESIVMALIGGAMTFVGGVVLPILRSRAVMEVKNDELTKRVKKHNCLVARTYRLEQNVAVIRRDVESLDEKMGDERVSDEQHLGMMPTVHSRGARGVW